MLMTKKMRLMKCVPRKEVFLKTKNQIQNLQIEKENFFTMGINSKMGKAPSKGNLRENALMSMYKDDRNFRADKLN